MENIRPSLDIFGMEENQVGLDLNKPRFRKHSKCIPNPDIIQQIDMTEIKFLKAIGKGSFGIVHKALWSGRTVAVKKVETDTEVTAFQNEIKQLSRVKHENIIEMYGTGSSLHTKCMIMEFASDGSLYQLLHCPPLLKYNLSHALGWLLQCAKAIAYLHSIEPRPIIHRDLKPLNMLLTNDRKVLKICDFGTACDLRSVMTDNKGSTVWMAPEVIKGCNYNEKCDVYSWGIILWELLTRRMPFKELGQTYRILWQVVNQVRPPLIQGCPKPIEKLMKRCWLDGQSERPSMQEVVEIVFPLYRIVCGIEELGNRSSGDSNTGSSVSFSNEELSENHTSDDVSELNTGTNGTLDSPNHCKDQNNESSASCAISSINSDQDVNCNERMDQRIVSRPPFSIISPVSPSILVLPPIQSELNDVSSSKVNSGRISFVRPPPPEMQTPLSVSIPNEGPTERVDIALVYPNGNIREEPAGTQHIPDASCAPHFPWIIPPPVNIPDSTSVSYLGELNSVIDSVPSSASHSLQSLDSFHISDVHTAPTDFTIGIPSPTSSFNQTSKSSSVYIRPHLQSQSYSRNWRKSAEAPYNHSIPDSDLKGHKRSSSYEYAKLIGFEPFAAETMLETHCPPKLELKSLETGLLKEEQHCKEIQFTDVIGNFSPAINNQVKTSPTSVSGVFPCNIGVEAAPTGVSSSALDPSTNKGFISATPLISSPVSRTIQSTASVQRPFQKSSSPDIVGTEDDELGAFWQLLEDDVKPAMPMPSCTQSQNIFNDHKGLAHQLFVIQEEIVYLEQEKKRLLLKLDDHVKEQHSCRQRYSDKISQLKNKNESLRLDYCRLSKQLEAIRTRRNKYEPSGVSAELPEGHQSPQHESHFCSHVAQGQPIAHVSQDSLRQLPQLHYCDPHPQCQDNS